MIKIREGKTIAVIISIMLLTAVIGSNPLKPAEAAVGDVIKTINLDPIIDPAAVYCSIGVAFDGTYLYVDACNDPNIYKIDTDGNLISTFNVVGNGSSVNPNALAFDAKRNGIWFGGQSCTSGDMPIHFWNFSDNTVTQMFIIPSGLTNPATGEQFVQICFVDGLAYNENDPNTDADDEIWFSADVNRNVGLFRPDGTFVNGFDASTIDPSLSSTSGLAIGGDNLYLGNNGGGDVFRANKNTMTLVDQFVSGNDRQEDMECDPVTFAPTEVMWVRTTPQGGIFPNVLTAHEIEPGTCGIGGGSGSVKGKMYGGGKFMDEETGKHVGLKFNLNCDISENPQILRVSFDGKLFTLSDLTSATCSDDPSIDEGFPAAGFDTYTGSGTGKLNWASGYTIEFTFKDAGEPGGDDTVSIVIKDAADNTVLNVAGELSSGNIQADPRT